MRATRRGFLKLCLAGAAGVAANYILPQNAYAEEKLHVPVLMYHRILERQEGDFERQVCSLLESGYMPIGPDQLVGGLNGTEMPEKPIIVTMDDGWASQYEIAFPVLQKYSFPATLFAITDYAGEHDKRFMPWKAIKEMSDFGITIGSRSASFPRNLVQGYKERGDAWLMQELADSKKAIEDITGKECYAFSYPNGSRDEHVVDAVKKSGYKCAFIPGGGSTQRKSGVFELNRVPMGAEMPLDTMHRRIEGFWWL